MFHVPGYYRDISLKLSSVLEDVGVSERLVLKRRRAALLKENLETITHRIKGRNMSVHYFGSQSEGTTTLGLDSDTDVVYCMNDWNVIEDWADWKAGACNVRMIQDENVSPGYCMLQELYDNVPAPLNEILDDYDVHLREGMVVLKNSWFDHLCPSGNRRKGPAFNLQHSEALDNVVAYPCRTIPRVLDNWIHKQMLYGKLSPEMKTYIERNRCFVVSVGNTFSSYEYLEWRISTSHAERCIMYNLNITQIRCYVMMKMMLKSFLERQHVKGLSSFMCKNILILCIEKTPSELWCPANLLQMVTLCLFQLQNCIIHKQCPHFIERRNNLMGRKFSHDVRVWLLKQVQDVIFSNGLALLEITIDDLGLRLKTKLNLVDFMVPSKATSGEISGFLMGTFAGNVSVNHREILDALSSGSTSWPSIFKLFARLPYQDSESAQVVGRLLRAFLFSNFGCVLASSSLQQNDVVSPESFVWLRAGMNSDVASGRLKLASVLYAVGDFDSVNSILRSIEEAYSTDLVEAVCSCMNSLGYRTIKLYWSERFTVYADSHHELSVTDLTAHCVRFLQSEINCIPRELQYELFRSSQEDLLHRDEKDFWMDWAVVDSLPFLYFLQYKTYGLLRRPGDQQRALRNLTTSGRWVNANFGHRETAWNLAGQCMMQEDRPEDAFQCYVKSLTIRARNNAANIHICRLLYRIMCSQNLE